MKERRSDCFFGVHLDYHAKPENNRVQGEDLKEDDIRRICRTLKPDFIQIDCKGHPGWASYPTKIGNAMPEFAIDTLALWRKVTREEGVRLYMHYSGVYDRKYCSENPSEAITNPDGTVSTETTRLDGKYVDDLLIPQLLELAKVYEVDGVWVDGDCWMATPDFRPESLAKFEKETGTNLGGAIPKSENDPNYHEYREYSRELFRKYLNRYVDAVHEECPSFEIASNWAFSDHMPEKVCANVDFLSGDLNPLNGFNSARYASRALAGQEYAWDLMSWNFRIVIGSRGGYVPKHPVQIMQEASAVIATGGAFQDYIPQHKDGSPNMRELENLANVSKFIRERKDFCFRGKLVHQACLLLSTYDRYRESKNLFSRTGFERTMGVTSLLCDIGQSLEVVCESTLEKYINEYKMIVIPELSNGLDEKTVSMLYEYAKNGGALLLIGSNTCSIFAKYERAPFSVNDMEEFIDEVLDKTKDGHDNRSNSAYMPYLFDLGERDYGALYSPCEIVANGHTWANVFKRDVDGKNVIATTVPYGLGSITLIGFDIGSQYLSGEQYLHRVLMKNITNELYSPIVRVENVCGRLEVVVLEVDGRLCIQLVNGNGTHANSSCATDDNIPPLLDIKLSIELKNEPKKLVLQPQGEELAFEYRGGRATVLIDRVDIHDIIEVSL